MNARKLVIVALTIVLLIAVFTGAVSALNGKNSPVVRAQLANVRDFTAVASQPDSFAVDGGALFTGQPGAWTQISTPETVIVSSVAVDSTDPTVVYIGAANEMAIYRTLDNGQSWLRIPLADGFVGGVTDIAVDGAQRIVYVGTDTAGLFRMRDVGSSVVLSGHLLLDAPVLEVWQTTQVRAWLLLAPNGIYTVPRTLVWPGSPSTICKAPPQRLQLPIQHLRRSMLAQWIGVSWSATTAKSGQPPTLV